MTTSVITPNGVHSTRHGPSIPEVHGLSEERTSWKASWKSGKNRAITDKVYEKAGLLDGYVEGLGDKFRDPDSLKPWERDILSRLDDG